MTKNKSFLVTIKRRNIALRCLLVLMLVYMIVVGELGLADSRVMTPLAETVSRLLFFGGMAWVIWKIRRNKTLLDDTSMRKGKLIHERDERNRRLHEQSGGVVWDILFVWLLFLTLTASVTNMPAFYMALTILVTAVALKIAACFYYRKKAETT